MKKTLSFLASLLLSSTLFTSLATVGADELVSRVPADAGAYCHMKFAEMRSDTLGWEKPILDEGAADVVDFYGPCDYDPTGIDAITAQRHVMNRGIYDDGE
jgi:hypothetical protein